MYCAFCKKQIEDDALFCPYCGKSAPEGDALAKLAAAAHAGDQDAIGALYEKTYSKVYYTVKSMIKEEDAVPDIVQDTYIKAFTHLDSFQGDTKFLPWVRRIAVNTARDWMKKKRPMLFAELSSGEGQDTPVEEQFPDERGDHLPDQIIDQKETKRLIREIIEDLPEDQRAVIGMFYYEEMSVKEIAAALGVSESAVKSRLMYGRNKIEKRVLELEKQGTKLYSLSPLPFLLLLFRSQKAYACEAPDGRILQAVLAARPMGSAAGAAAAGAGAADAGTAGAGAAGAGTAAAAGGLGALKIGLIALAATAVVGLGAFGAVWTAANSSEPQEPSAGSLVGQKEPEATQEPSAPAEKVVFSGPEDKNCTNYVIPEGVTEIGDYAFWGCSDLISIEIPDSVTKIGVYAFSGCSALTGIEIPEGVTKISSSVFQHCNSLTGIELPEGVTEIGDGAFSDCCSLTGIELPKGVTEIGNFAFESCRALTSIEIPEGVTEIGDGTFANCDVLTGIKIPDSVTKIGVRAFVYCLALTSIELPEGVTEIGENAFTGCISLTGIEIPNSVTEIGRAAFHNCDSLKTIRVPEGMDVNRVRLRLDPSVQVTYY